MERPRGASLPQPRGQGMAKPLPKRGLTLQSLLHGFPRRCSRTQSFRASCRGEAGSPSWALPQRARRAPAGLRAAAGCPAPRGLSTWPEACLPTPLFVARPPQSPCSAFTVHTVTLFGVFCGSPAIKYIKIICSFSLSVLFFLFFPSDYKLLL